MLLVLVIGTGWFVGLIIRVAVMVGGTVNIKMIRWIEGLLYRENREFVNGWGNRTSCLTYDVFRGIFNFLFYDWYFRYCAEATGYAVIVYSYSLVTALLSSYVNA